MSSSSSLPKGLMQALGSLNLFKKPSGKHAERGKGSRGGSGEADRQKHSSGAALHSRTASVANGSQNEATANVGSHSRGFAPAATVGSVPSSALVELSASSAAPSTAPASVSAASESARQSSAAHRAAAPPPPGPVDVDVEMGYPADVVVDYWRQKELKRHRKMDFDKQPEYLPHRRYMVDWLSEVGEELHLQAVTIHAAVAFLDEIMTATGYHHGQWRLQAVCCLSVAAKYEEAECNMPMISEIADATELRLTTAMITKGELDLVRALGWDVSRVSAMHFLGYYLYRGVTFPEDQCQGRPLVDKVVRYVKKYVEFFANLCQQDHRFLDHTQSAIAAASVLSARRALCITPLWRPELVKLTRMDEIDMKACAEQLWEFYEKMFPAHKPLRTESPKCVSDFDAPGV